MLILIVILYLLLASTFTAAKAALQYAPPLFLVGIRMTLAGFILLTYYNYRYKTAKNRENITKDWKLFLAVALFHIYITYVLDFWSLQYMTSGKSAFIYSLSPFAAALFSYLVYGQTLTFGQKLSIILGFLSITPILLSSTQTTDLLGIGVPELALLVAMFSGTYAWILVRKLMDKGYPLVLINGVAMLIGGGGSLFTSYYFERSSAGVNNWIPFLGWTLLLILLSNILFYNLYGYLLRYYSLTFLTCAGFLTPLFSALLGAIFLGEQFYPIYWLSLLGIAISLGLFYSSFEKQ